MRQQRLHFAEIQRILFRSYFALNLDITAPDTLARLWSEAGLPESEIALAEDPRWSEEARAEHEEAIRLGAGGVPAVRVDGDDSCITGAYPVDMYRRWARRLLGS